MAHHYEHFYLDPKFWVAVSFFIFVALVGRMAWAKITAMLDGRAQQVRTDLAEASRLRTEAEALLKQAEAEGSAKRRERMALDRIAAAEAGAVAEVRGAASEIAVAAARSVIAERIDAKADAALIDSAVASLPTKLRA